MAGTTPRLAVGTPYEDLGSATNAGMVQRFNFHNVATNDALNQDSSVRPVPSTTTAATAHPSSPWKASPSGSG